MSDVVPLTDLPDELRVQIQPGTPAFKAYAERAERDNKLPPGSLTGATFKFPEGSDPAQMLAAAAQQVQKEKAQRAREDAEYERKRAELMNPLHGASRGERALIGAGKMFADLGRGAGQLMGLVSQEDVDDAARRDKPLMSDPWALTGYAGGSAATSMLPFGLAARGAAALRAGPLATLAANPYAQAAVLSGAQGALQPVETGASRGAQAGFGAAAGLAGQGLAHGLQGLVRSAGATATPAVRALAEKAHQYGIPLRAADVSDNRVLRAVSGALDKVPFSGGQAAREAAQKGFNRALARRLGEDTDDFSVALAASRGRNEGVYRTVLGRNLAELDPSAHGTKLLTALRDFERTDVSQGRQVTASLRAYLDNIFDPANGHGILNPSTGKFQMQGEVYKRFRSEAAALARSYKAAANTGSNPQGASLAKFYGEVKSALDDSIRKSSTMSAADRAAITKADREWSAMRTLENMAPKDASGDVDFSKLAALLTRSGPNAVYPRDAMIYGRGDQTLPELARIGTQFLDRGAPPTGWKAAATQAARVAAPAATGAGLYGGLYGMNSHLGEQNPAGLAALQAAAILAGGRGVSSALNSQWFSRGAPAALRVPAEKLGAPMLRGAPLGALEALLRGSDPGLAQSED